MLTALTTDFRPRSIYDVAVIGAGAAGIALAQTLRSSGLTVFLAEGGGLEISERSQGLYKAEVRGDPYHDLQTGRLRYFGGTTGHWGGDCRPLDSRDFRAKRAAPWTAWPIDPEVLKPFSARARSLLGLGPFKTDEPRSGAEGLCEARWTYSDPIRFGEAYRASIAEARNVDAVLHCNFVGFERVASTIQTARFVNFDGVPLEVRARRYVLACGGVENSRILLNENRKFNDALGNGNGLVGRYWFTHLAVKAARIAVFDPADLEPIDPGASMRVWTWTPTRGERLDVLNACAKIYLDTERDAALLADLADAPGLSPRLSRRLGRARTRTGRVTVWIEQEPRRENRILLDEALDELGMPRAVLQFRRSPLDHRTVLKMTLDAADHLARHDIGRARVPEWLLSDVAEWDDEAVGAGYHFMGGTRMAASPEAGVVDSDCKVFGVDNLYVAGSSVFPSGGHANPTYTIVQLALRLADHLMGAARKR